MTEALLLFLALVFALNIGASGAAAAMGEVYGAGVLKKRNALLLVGVFALLGAVLAGGKVVETIGTGIIPGGVANPEIAVVILVAAVLPLFIANLLAIPLSTSEVAVGSVVGVGLALGSVDLAVVGIIVLSWVLVPVLAFAITTVVQRLVGQRAEQKIAGLAPGALLRLLSLFLIVAGCYVAFSAGANNAANAIGPLVGAGVLTPQSGLLLAGLFMAGGAIALGSRVVETNGRRITKLSIPAAINVDITAGTLVIGLTFMGIPVPLTQATTGGIIGVGFARSATLQKEVVRKILSVWLVSPVVSLLLAYVTLNFLRGLEGDLLAPALIGLGSVALVLAAIIMRGGVHALPRLLRNLRAAVVSLGVHEHAEAPAATPTPAVESPIPVPARDGSHGRSSEARPATTAGTRL